MNPVQWKLLGESIREIGVLILVFVPLDIWITPSSKSGEPVYPHWMAWMHFISVDHWRILLFGVGGLAVLYYGIKVEARAVAMIEDREGRN